VVVVVVRLLSIQLGSAAAAAAESAAVENFPCRKEYLSLVLPLITARGLDNVERHNGFHTLEFAKLSPPTVFHLWQLYLYHLVAAVVGRRCRHNHNPKAACCLILVAKRSTKPDLRVCVWQRGSHYAATTIAVKLKAINAVGGPYLCASTDANQRK
jgi:hypothetical protein